MIDLHQLERSYKSIAAEIAFELISKQRRALVHDCGSDAAKLVLAVGKLRWKEMISGRLTHDTADVLYPASCLTPTYGTLAS